MLLKSLRYHARRIIVAEDRLANVIDMVDALLDLGEGDEWRWKDRTTDVLMRNYGEIASLLEAKGMATATLASAMMGVNEVLQMRM